MTTNEYLTQASSTSYRFLLFWVLACLGFPIAGLLANLASSVTTPARALLAGAIAGATLGLIQWLILRTRLPLLPIWWVVASSAGMALGLAISTVVFGSETAGSELLWRGAITGFCLGLAQFIVFRTFLPLPQWIIWVGVVSVGWALGWYVTRTVGIDLSPKWSVFGISGALTFQILTGLALNFLLRIPHGLRLRRLVFSRSRCGSFRWGSGSSPRDSNHLQSLSRI
jgi:hypothetical protein